PVGGGSGDGLGLAAVNVEALGDVAGRRGHEVELGLSGKPDAAGAQFAYSGEIPRPAAVELAVGVVVGRREVAIVFVGIEHVVEVPIFAADHLGSHALDKFELLDGPERGSAGLIWVTQPLIGACIGSGCTTRKTCCQSVLVVALSPGQD